MTLLLGGSVRNYCICLISDPATVHKNFIILNASKIRVDGAASGRECSLGKLQVKISESEAIMTETCPSLYPPPHTFLIILIFHFFLHHQPHPHQYQHQDHYHHHHPFMERNWILSIQCLWTLLLSTPNPRNPNQGPVLDTFPFHTSHTLEAWSRPIMPTEKQKENYNSLPQPLQKEQAGCQIATASESL